MRTERDAGDFEKRVLSEYLSKCKKCRNGGDPLCSCRKNAIRDAKLYESCIPRDFWRLEPKNVKFNTEVYKHTISAYLAKLSTAHTHGYGLLFSGGNGVGKTTFLCLVLRRALKAGFTVYYTTLPDLVYHISKGLYDRTIAKRIEWYLTSDFVAIDEVGKDKVKNQRFAAEFHLERILKNRFDGSKPTLLASNMSAKEIREEYGRTVHSMLRGKYQSIAMKEGDFRNNLRKRMLEVMEYEE